MVTSEGVQPSVSGDEWRQPPASSESSLRVVQGAETSIGDHSSRGDPRGQQHEVGGSMPSPVEDASSIDSVQSLQPVSQRVAVTPGNNLHNKATEIFAEKRAAQERSRAA
jgi:hypothetical protein